MTLNRSLGFKNLADGGALAEYNALRRWNAICPDTGFRLHMSGVGITRNPFAAWVGTRVQFDNLKRQKGMVLEGFNLRKVHVENKQAVFE